METRANSNGRKSKRERGIGRTREIDGGRDVVDVR